MEISTMDKKFISGTREVKSTTQEKKVICQGCGAPMPETASRCRHCLSPIRKK